MTTLDTLDTLARSAVTAVDESVADLAIPAAPGADTPLIAWTTVTYALAGAAAAVVVLLALVVAAPDQHVSDEPVTTSVVPSTSLPDTPFTSSTVPETADGVPNQPEPSEPAPAPVAPIGGDTGEPTADITPPSLTVTTPTDGEHVEKELLEFTGATEPGATVLASGKFPADVGTDGSWSVKLVLSPGPNGVVFTASDPAGNVSEVRMTVYRDVEGSKESTTTTTAESWEFTAWQAYGSCSEPVPYDIFEGTATPGHSVIVTSPYGSGSTTANGDGGWSLRVEFPEAPYNVPFEVKAKDEYGHRKTFTFVSLHAG